MCSNYVPVTASDRLLNHFGVTRDREAGELPVDVWPSGVGPFIRLAEPGSDHKLALEEGLFGLVPPARAEMASGQRERLGRGFYNARSETVHRLESFRQPWAQGQRCIIPAEAIYEPNYESGQHVRWRIRRPWPTPMGIAGIYRWSTLEDGTEGWTYAMLTVNADDHPFMRRFHKPGDEKRMVVILDEAQYGPWLQCPVQEAKSFCIQWHGELVGEPAPLPQRATAGIRKPPAPRPLKPPKPPKAPKPPPPPTTGNLF